MWFSVLYLTLHIERTQRNVQINRFSPNTKPSYRKKYLNTDHCRPIKSRWLPCLVGNKEIKIITNLSTQCLPVKPAVGRLVSLRKKKKTGTLRPPHRNSHVHEFVQRFGIEADLELNFLNWTKLKIHLFLSRTQATTLVGPVMENREWWGDSFFRVYSLCTTSRRTSDQQTLTWVCILCVCVCVLCRGAYTIVCDTIASSGLLFFLSSAAAHHLQTSCIIIPCSKRPFLLRNGRKRARK